MPTRRELANVIRVLAMDAVQQANSGHPGAPMGMADMAEVLWREFLKHNPANPRWWNRDRFILSNGHASMLLYAVLHLTGYPVAIEELRNFRQLGSRTAGHPEHDLAMGIETTTGPLGRVSQTPWVLRWPKKCLRRSSISPGSISLIITPGCSWVTVVSWKASRTRPRHSPAHWGWVS